MKLKPMRPEPLEMRLQRNRGLVAPGEQGKIAGSRVLVAGVGGVGGRVAESLARLGVGELVVADPDTFSVTNLNRQAACTSETLGLNKAEVIGDLCRSVGCPSVAIIPQGIQSANLEELLDGVDLVVEATDYTKPEVGLSLARAASRRGIPVLMAIEAGFGAWVTVVLPGEFPYEAILGLPAGIEPSVVGAGQVTVPLWRWIGQLPAYVRLSDLRLLAAGDLEAPAIAPGTELAAGIAAAAAFDVLVGRRPSAVAPRVFHVDAREAKAWTYRPSRWRFAVSLARAIFWR